MREYRCCDSSLDKSKSDTYHLSLLASTRGLTYAVLDPFKSLYLAFGHSSFRDGIEIRDLPKTLEDKLREDELLTLKYDSVYCMMGTKKSTLIPSGLYNKDMIRSYFEFNHDLGDLDELHANYLKHLDAYLVFSVYHEVSNAIIRHFPNAGIFNQSTAFIENALLQQETGSEQVSACFQHDFFDIIFLRGKELVLHNTFPCRNPSDPVYFMLYVYDKLKLDPEVVTLNMCGEIESGMASAELIGNFIRNIGFSKASPHYEYSQGFRKMHEHAYSNLCNLYHCVS